VREAGFDEVVAQCVVERFPALVERFTTGFGEADQSSPGVRWWAVSVVGCGSLWLVISFLAVPDVMATAIGFNRTPFEFEIAFANLALAVLGFRAASATARERVTIGLGAGMFLWGATIGHLYQWFANGDHAPGNTGGILVYDILMPAVMIILARRSQRLSAVEQPAAPALA
jgi:hypothetical protein